MSADAWTRLACNAAGCEAAFGPAPGGAPAVRRQAEDAGWGRAHGPDGLPWDLCPSHADTYETAAALARLKSRRSARQATRQGGLDALAAARAAGVGNKWG